MKKIEVVPGQRFGRLVASKEVEARGYHRRVECVCDCGITMVTFLDHLRSGSCRSCGCLRRDEMSKRPPSVQFSARSRSRSYLQWRDMKRRSVRPYDHEYIRRGGPLAVYQPWFDSYDTFIADMGECPPNYTLGRIDNEAGYYPSNCRWETRKQQANNRRTSVIVEWKGERHTIAEWSEITGIGAPRLYWRYHRGYRDDRLFDSHDARL